MLRSAIFNYYRSIPISFFIILILLFSQNQLHAQSLDFPSSEYGISIGNSKKFTGLRINWRDSGVEEIKGVNLTLWTPGKHVNRQAKITGISLGLQPSGGYLTGLNLGLLGVGAANSLKGINIGFIGMGSAGAVSGLNIGGICAGAGGDLKGFNIGGIGFGAGGNLTGFNIVGIGGGAGGSLKGFNIAGIGVGAGGNLTGLNIAGVGAGTGGDLKYINIAGIGFGSGGSISGLNIAGIGMGAGSQIKGFSIAGLGAGASEFKGVTIAGGTIRVKDGGILTGFAASAFNQIKGTQKGVSLGIVNYAYKLEGLQIGLINIVRDNPDFKRILPLVNWNFD